MAGQLTGFGGLITAQATERADIVIDNRISGVQPGSKNSADRYMQAILSLPKSETS